MQPLVIIVYIVLGMFQLAAVTAGLGGWIGLHGTIAVLLAYFIAYTPLVGSVVGMFAAVALWDWSWLHAAELFFGPYLVILMLAMTTGVFRRLWKGSRIRSVAG